MSKNNPESLDKRPAASSAMAQLTALLLSEIAKGSPDHDELSKEVRQSFEDNFLEEAVKESKDAPRPKM